MGTDSIRMASVFIGEIGGLSPEDSGDPRTRYRTRISLSLRQTGGCATKRAGVRHNGRRIIITSGELT
jgi:hypothetical protein